MGGVHIAEALRIPYYRAFTVSLSSWYQSVQKHQQR